MSGGTTNYSQHVPAADRVLSILEYVVSAPDGVATADLLDLVDGSRSGTYALLNTLRSRGYIATTDGIHRPGVTLRSLISPRSVGLEDMTEAFRATSQAGAFEETNALSWPDGRSAVIAAESPGIHRVRAAYTIGSRRPDDTADSRVILAADTRHHQNLEQVRRDGVCITRTDDLVEIAAPVCLDGFLPAAAVLVGIPSYRAAPAKMPEVVEQVRRFAARISYRLGANVYIPYGGSERVMGPSSELETDELKEFLDGLWGAQLACVRPDGKPHVVPLWYEWDGSNMWFAASPGASWRSYLLSNPLVSVTLDEPWPPLRRAFISGCAEEVPADVVPGGIAGLRRRLAIRYLGRGVDQSSELTEAEGWVAIRVRAERIHGKKGLGLSSLETLS